MNKTAERRMKLFQDAEHYGAEILKAPGWTAAVCRTYDQTHCFGRGKPKVIPGTNEIDPDCNLRDDEGIDDASRKIRDSRREAYVKDGIGFDDQPFEAGWCVMGGNPVFGGSTLAWGPGLEPCESYKHGGRVYCPGKVPGEACPYLVFLEEATGKLYISNVSYSKWGMLALGDGWQIADFNCELNGNTEGGVGKKIKSDQNFADIMQQAVDASMKGMTGAVETNVADAVKKAEEAAKRFASFGSWRRRPNWKTVYSLIIEIIDAGAEMDDEIFYEHKGDVVPVARLKEGAGSSVVFDTDWSGAVTVGDLSRYCKSRNIGKSAAMSRRAEVKYEFALSAPGTVTRENGQIIIHYA